MQLPKLIGGIYAIEHNASGASFLEVPLAPASAFTTPCSMCH